MDVHPPSFGIVGFDPSPYPSNNEGAFRKSGDENGDCWRPSPWYKSVLSPQQQEAGRRSCPLWTAASHAVMHGHCLMPMQLLTGRDVVKTHFFWRLMLVTWSPEAQKRWISGRRPFMRIICIVVSWWLILLDVLCPMVFFLRTGAPLFTVDFLRPSHIQSQAWFIQVKLIRKVYIRKIADEPGDREDAQKCTCLKFWEQPKPQVDFWIWTVTTCGNPS